jgi:hypothetical protein
MRRDRPRLREVVTGAGATVIHNETRRTQMRETTRDGAQGLHQASLTQVSWKSINEPGAYFDLQTGRLYRIPEEALRSGASPVIHMEGAEDRFAKISDDPLVRTDKARSICAENNCTPTF